jgi:hypothetical protein
VRLFGLGARHQAGGVVATDLGRTGALWGGAVEAGDLEVVRGQAALEVGADRDANTEKMNSGAVRTPMLSPTPITNGRRYSAPPVPYGGMKRSLANHLLARFDELLGGHVRHQQAGAAALHARGVLVRTEQVDRAVLATIGLQAFEALLAIVKGRGAFADVQHVVFGQGAFVPLAIAKVDR